jgi:hypothetical protein
MGATPLKAASKVIWLPTTSAAVAGIVSAVITGAAETVELAAPMTSRAIKCQCRSFGII